MIIRGLFRWSQANLEVFLMLNTRPGKTWAYMKTDPNWWGDAAWLRKDHTVPPEWPFWRWQDFRNKPDTLCAD